MLTEIYITIEFFVYILPAAFYFVLLPSLLVGELLHQIFPTKYPNNIAIKYIEAKS